jgi:hypothetical protein
MHWNRRSRLGRSPHPTEKNRVRVRVRLGNEKERGGSRAIAESVFEPGNCPSLSNRSDKVGIARPKRGSNLAIVPQSSSNSSSYSVPSLIFPNGIALSGHPASLSTGCTGTEGHNSEVGLLRPGTSVMPPVQSDNDQDFYQPPRDPQFNTARDQ